MTYRDIFERLRSLVFFLVIILFAGLLTTGCSSKSTRLYDWGSYERDLYYVYKKASTRADTIRRLEELILRLESRNKLVAPGLYSEMGTFYLQDQRVSEAIIFYKKEREAWPESRKLMTRLIDNLNALAGQAEDLGVIK